MLKALRVNGPNYQIQSGHLSTFSEGKKERRGRGVSRGPAGLSVSIEILDLDLVLGYHLNPESKLDSFGVFRNSCSTTLSKTVQRRPAGT